MIDFIILTILALCILAGYYRGVLYSAISLGISAVAFILALLLCPLLSRGIQQQKTLYDMMLYYFEGYEYINKTSVELVHVPVDQVDAATLEEVVQRVEMPRPFDRAVRKNVRSQAYRSREIYTLGDYFNQTLVDVVLNILSLLILFALFRMLLGFVLRLIDYGKEGLPVLRHLDIPFSCGIGLLHGILLMYIVFMLCPLMLAVVPRTYTFLQNSPLGMFFYKSNLLLQLVPTL